MTAAAPAIPATGAAAPLLEVRGVSRAFGSVNALKHVDLRVEFGEIVGLVGENGAGKSTLLNIICGVDRGYTGDVLLSGTAVRFSNYHQATSSGVFRIFQELALVPNLSVYENLFLSHEDRFSRAGVILRGKMKAAAAAMFEEFGHGWVDPAKRVSQYDFSTRQTIEIIKAFALARLLEIERPLLLLDEPTAGLSREETSFFFESIRSISERAGMIFVSHRLAELFELSDRIYVFKDGERTAEADPANLTESDLHFLMVGRRRDAALYQETLQRDPSPEVALEVRGLTLEPHFREVDLVVRRGEITGLAGVVASGKSELARALFADGVRPSGDVLVGGETVSAASVRHMIAAGVGYVSPDRATDGIIPSASISWNMSLASLALPGKSVVLDLGAEKQAAEESVRRLDIRPPVIKTPIGRLSGGNQQKAILARWLKAGVGILILDNPTKGIDVGAKQDVYRIIRQFVADGGSVLLISDDLVELIGLSNRIVAMKDGRVTATVDAPADAKPPESEILRHMV